ncbi:alpha/beta fold hydrolase [Parashewanella spongiae]|uniref:Alpha/beta fold hydrolase n=1 Tax=Parashewanella spongiae TaxID=342950 RepID=A0A3A6TW84_9GAMM|nr:alpha/beta fold hydrolase [Parashewanella spongiae]MCL1077501.1 alpha/beta fold hydrolase [Parashewanella spongiae]RJY18642.1 alpha/beta fold hydrolase [Parashewanella spongiae]
MNYVVSGQGTAVILLHGLFGNLDNLKTLSNELDTHYQVIRVDLPNHGKSMHTDELTFDDITHELSGIFKKLNLTKAHIVGHSMGGKAALAFALSHPDMCLSITAADIAPSAYPRRHDNVFSGLMSLPLESITDRKSALVHLMQSGIDNPTAQFLLKNLQRDEAGFSWKMNLDGLFDSYENLINWPYQNMQYSGPCLFIRGGDSNYVTEVHRKDILSQFPNTQAKTIAGTGHWLHAQKPAIFNRIVKEFIDTSNTDPLSISSDYHL